jgi:hypothetical protein
MKEKTYKDRAGKFYRVYRLSYSLDQAKVFVHFHRVRSEEDNRLYGREVYHTEKLEDFNAMMIDPDSPPPLP